MSFGITSSGFGEGEAFHRTSPDGVRGEKAILHSPEVLRSRTGTTQQESWRLSRITQYAIARSSRDRACRWQPSGYRIDAGIESNAVVTEAHPSHHRSDGRFQNPWPSSAPQGLGGILRWMLYDRVVHPRAADPPASAFPVATSSFTVPREDRDLLSATWVGHSTVLLQFGGTNILTDPIWSARASPVAFAGPRRIVGPAVSLGALPPLDVVLLSHNHYDHLDDRTVRALAERDPDAVWAVPLGLAQFVRARGVQHVAELDWWQTTAVGTLTLTCAPAQHFSARGLGDRNRTLWCSWSVATSGRAVYFGGDTAYHTDFAQIGERCGPFDLTLLPIGAYEPRWFMRSVHMSADEAVRAHLDLTSAWPGTPRPPLLPIHWGTFRLTDEPLEEPPARARAAWSAAGLPLNDLWLLRHGETRRVALAR